MTVEISIFGDDSFELLANNDELAIPHGVTQLPIHVRVKEEDLPQNLQDELFEAFEAGFDLGMQDYGKIPHGTPIESLTYTIENKGDDGATLKMMFKPHLQVPVIIRNAITGAEIVSDGSYYMIRGISMGIAKEYFALNYTRPPVTPPGFHNQPLHRRLAPFTFTDDGDHFTLTYTPGAAAAAAHVNHLAANANALVAQYAAEQAAAPAQAEAGAFEASLQGAVAAPAAAFAPFLNTGPQINDPIYHTQTKNKKTEPNSNDPSPNVGGRRKYRNITKKRKAQKKRKSTRRRN